MEKANLLSRVRRCFWKGAAARIVASKAISDVLPSEECQLYPGQRYCRFLLDCRLPTKRHCCAQRHLWTRIRLVFRFVGYQLPSLLAFFFTAVFPRCFTASFLVLISRLSISFRRSAFELFNLFRQLFSRDLRLLKRPPF